MVDEPVPNNSPEDSDQEQAESSNEAATPVVETPTTTQAAAAVSSDEELPDWEELTPEFFEDECVRGDFMLRWAAILVALLMGFTYLTETSVLVSIRTGQYIADHGFLPPRTDPFAVSTEGSSWVNLHWLSDLIIGQLHRSSGFLGLTILTGLKFGLSFWLLSRICLKNVSSWWNSICCVLIAVAVFPGIQPGMMSVTLLGFSALLYLMHQWRERPDSNLAWGLPVLFVFWANSDSRAWVGLLFFLVIYVMDLVLRRATRTQMIAGAVAILAALLISPWPIQPLFGFQEALANAAQAQEEGLSGTLFPRYAYGMITSQFWENVDVFPIAAAVLIGFSFVCQFLNANRLDWSLTLAWITLNSLSFYFGELIPYVSIVNGIVAAINGQDWYRHRFKNDYSITGMSVFFARAGRAVTVLSIFAVAYTAINGALMGPQGRRIGLGLDPRLQNQLDSTEQDLLAGISGDNVFNVRADQGDMLIWFGKKPYIDGRNQLFVNADPNLAEQHRLLRASIFSSGPLSEETLEESDAAENISWQEEFEKLGIQSIILRLWGDEPAYSPFMMLVGTRSWPMTGFGAAGGVFTRGDLNDPEIKQHIESHVRTNFTKQAYGLSEESQKVVDGVQIWPRAQTTYDKWLIQKLTVTPNPIQQARHYNVIAVRLQNVLAIDQAMALAELAIRSAAEGLQESPDDPDGYRVMMDAQSLLEQAEQRFLALNGQGYGLQLRSQQALCHAFHAAKASGQDLNDLRRLFLTLVNHQSLDTAQIIADRYFERTGQPIMITSGDDEESIAKAKEVLAEIATHVENVKTQVEEARAEEISLPQLASIALNGRCPTLALSILEEDKTILEQDPRLKLMYSSLLLSNGRTEEAWETIEGMQAMVDQIQTQMPSLAAQLRSSSAIANLVANIRERPAKLFSEDAAILNKQNIQALMVQPPSATNPAPTMDLWAAITLRTHAGALLEFPERWSLDKMQEAVVRLDQGDVEQAKAAFQAILKGNPEFSMRALVALYLTLITGEEVEPSPPSAWIPVWGDMFVPDEPEDEQPQDNNPPTSPQMKSPPKTNKVPDEKPANSSAHDGSSTQKRPPSPSLPGKISD